MRWKRYPRRWPSRVCYLEDVCDLFSVPGLEITGDEPILMGCGMTNSKDAMGQEAHGVGDKQVFRPDFPRVTGTRLRGQILFER